VRDVIEGWHLAVRCCLLFALAGGEEVHLLALLDALVLFLLCCAAHLRVTSDCSLGFIWSGVRPVFGSFWSNTSNNSGRPPAFAGQVGDLIQRGVPELRARHRAELTPERLYRGGDPLVDVSGARCGTHHGIQSCRDVPVSGLLEARELHLRVVLANRASETVGDTLGHLLNNSGVREASRVLRYLLV
jgi:hypothetical protein